MKPIRWSPEKNVELIQEREISFEDVVFCLSRNGLLDDLIHPNQKNYPNQRMFVVEIDSYAYLVPYVETSEEIFLKTAFPSRKATKIYLGG